MRSRAQRRRPNLGIYDPPEPNVRVLPETAREQWDAAYQQALEIYGDKGVAETTAWRNVRMNWRPGAGRLWEACANGRCVPWPRSMMLPQPQTDLVGLGVLVEYGFVDRRGDLQLRITDRNHPPILWWDDEQKILYAFPGTNYPGCMLMAPDDVKRGREIYKKWTKRQADCASEIEIPIVRMTCSGAADTVSYRSDKWKKKMVDPRVVGAQEYIHKHWHDVWLWQDDDGDPSAIMIQGGALDVHEKGIIH